MYARAVAFPCAICFHVFVSNFGIQYILLISPLPHIIQIHSTIECCYCLCFSNLSPRMPQDSIRKIVSSLASV